MLAKPEPGIISGFMPSHFCDTQLFVLFDYVFFTASETVIQKLKISFRDLFFTASRVAFCYTVRLYTRNILFFMILLVCSKMRRDKRNSVFFPAITACFVCVAL